MVPTDAELRGGCRHSWREDHISRPSPIRLLVEGLLELDIGRAEVILKAHECERTFLLAGWREELRWIANPVGDRPRNPRHSPVNLYAFLEKKHANNAEPQPIGGKILIGPSQDSRRQPG